VLRTLALGLCLDVAAAAAAAANTFTKARRSTFFFWQSQDSLRFPEDLASALFSVGFTGVLLILSVLAFERRLWRKDHNRMIKPFECRM
jgi:hypothetical protein